MRTLVLYNVRRALAQEHQMIRAVALPFLLKDENLSSLQRSKSFSSRTSND